MGWSEGGAAQTVSVALASDRLRVEVRDSGGPVVGDAFAWSVSQMIDAAPMRGTRLRVSAAMAAEGRSVSGALVVEVLDEDVDGLVSVGHYDPGSLVGNAATVAREVDVSVEAVWVAVAVGMRGEGTMTISPLTVEAVAADGTVLPIALDEPTWEQLVVSHEPIPARWRRGSCSPWHGRWPASILVSTAPTWDRSSTMSEGRPWSGWVRPRTGRASTSASSTG